MAVPKENDAYIGRFVPRNENEAVDPVPIIETPDNDPGTTIVIAREIDLRDAEQLRRYVSLLRHESNRYHFVGAPQTTEELRLELLRPEKHGLVSVNALDEEVAYAVIHDAPPGQHDHWIEWFVVRNDFQNRRRGMRHAGTNSLDKFVEWTFTTPTYDGRERRKLDAAVVMFVPNWERADRMFSNYGFEPRMRNPNQADVIVYGRRETKDVMRFELERDAWLWRRHLQQHSQLLD